MTKALHVLRIGFLPVGIFLAIFIVSLAVVPTTHAALALDATTIGMLSTTFSATQRLVNTVQSSINAGMFTPSQSVVLSATLGNIGSILGNISSMIGGSTIAGSTNFPNTGYSQN